MGSAVFVGGGQGVPQNVSAPKFSWQMSSTAEDVLCDLQELRVRVGAMACGGARLVARDLRGQKQCHRPRRRAGDGGSQRRRQENSCRSRGSKRPRQANSCCSRATGPDAMLEAAAELLRGVKQQSRNTTKEAVPQAQTPSWMPQAQTPRWRWRQPAATPEEQLVAAEAPCVGRSRGAVPQA